MSACRCDEATVSTRAAARADLRRLADPGKARILQGFFKTGPGEYGEGDVFLGIVVPRIRELVRRHRALTPADAAALLTSTYHEERELALMILVERFRSAGSAALRENIYQLYLEHRQHINNWDLVDLSAHHIVGAWLADKSRDVLDALAASASVWDRRIAIIATLHYIRNKQFEDTLRIASRLLRDPHDLIHKAVGWMLREVGKRDEAAEETFLRKYYRQMPRTMLRYAIERFPEKKRLAYLRGTA
jgi:3-methyladenine DNA glycosylase AlkD